MHFKAPRPVTIKVGTEFMLHYRVSAAGLAAVCLRAEIKEEIPAVCDLIAGSENETSGHGSDFQCCMS